MCELSSNCLSNKLGVVKQTNVGQQGTWRDLGTRITVVCNAVLLLCIERLTRWKRCKHSVSTAPS